MKRGRYHFRVQVITGPDRVTVRAGVWAAGSAEPGVWQAEAYDESGTRLTAGAVGVRTYGPGSKYFDDLAVSPLPSYTTTTVITSAYDAANRLNHFYEGGVLTDLAWDANPLRCEDFAPSFHFGDWRGNLLTQGTSVYTWDAANRLVSANVGGVVSSFEYDGSGDRTAQSVDGVTTEYVLDVAGGLPEVIVATTGGASTRYVQVQGQVLAQQEAGAWAYILPDALGSVRQLVGSDSRVDLAQSYDPFGIPFETSGSGESDFGYTGEWWDAEAALLYLRARYYDPVVGRFVSKDLWQEDSFTDPSGRIFCPYGVKPETGTCNPPRWEGRGEGLPLAFAQTTAADPASATAQVALLVLAYLYFRLADNLQPGPLPLLVGSPWEGLRERKRGTGSKNLWTSTVE
jgi:RHS repeat-associated protein